MKKISIIALHLGYGGVEKSISTLANLLATTPDIEIEIASVYELYDKPVFPLDDKIKVKYLLEKGIKSNEKEWRESLRKVRPITFVKESFKSLKILHLRRKEVINYIKETDADVIISTRVLFNGLVGLYAKDNVLKIGWEHNHYHNDMKYAMDVVASAKKLDYFILVSKDLQKFYRKELLEYKDNLIKNNPNDGVIFLRDFILAANLIPESFVIAQNSYGLLDSMGNNITPYLNNDKKYLVIDIHMRTTGNGTIDLAYNSCVALFKDIAKPLYHDFVSLRVSLDQENLQYRGSTTCKQAENYRCLVDMTLAEINRVCKVCVTNRNSCTLFMVF